jgi:hypothetical protein
MKSLTTSLPRILPHLRTPVEDLTPAEDPVEDLTPAEDPVEDLTPSEDPVEDLTPADDPVEEKPADMDKPTSDRLVKQEQATIDDADNVDQ